MSYFPLSGTFRMVPTDTYTIVRGCAGCGGKSTYRCANRFRVNANGKRLDVWLIYRCERCKHTYNLPVYSRVLREALSPEEYRALLANDPAAVARVGRDRALFLRCGAQLGGELPYRLSRLPDRAGEEGLWVQNPGRIRVRPDKLLSQCLEIPRARAKALLKGGEVVAEATEDGWRFTSAR